MLKEMSAIGGVVIIGAVTIALYGMPVSAQTVGNETVCFVPGATD